jgi:UDP-N-acetyl-L-fucosamine synthase
MKVMTIVGTRPELIRLSRVIALLDQHVEHILVHTGQNYDFELNEVFFRDLEIRKPDYFLDTDHTSLGRMIGSLIVSVEELLIKEKPDAILILGDTNSSMAVIIARRMRIPVYHMEAGNRSFDLNISEEVNRRLVDHVADFNLVYTEHARRNLLEEGLPPRQIYHTGSPMREVLEYYADKIETSNILRERELTKSGYILVSLHREENVDNTVSLTTALETFENLGEYFDCPVLVSTHPRTRNRLDKLGKTNTSKRVIFHKPFGYFDYIMLQKNALCVVSDSGTVSEESALLGFPAVTIRNSIERPEALDTGRIIICGLKKENVLRAVKYVCTNWNAEDDIPADYKVANTADRVLKLIIGTVDLVHGWNGIETQDLQ